MTKFAYALAGVLIIAIVGTLVLRSGDTLDQAGEYFTKGEYEEAKSILDRHLKRNPDDTKAKFLLAETMEQMSDFKTVRGAEEIVELLEEIPDDAPEGLKARLRTAQMALTSLNEVHRAEVHAKRALKLDPKNETASQVIWVIYQLTRRFPILEPYFDTVYEAAKPSERTELMKNWFLSQFRPFALNASFDRKININPGPASESQRYNFFLDLEPDAPSPRAAGASYYLDASKNKEALELLTAANIDRENADDFFLGQLVEAYVGSGEVDEALAEFKKWSGQKDGYMYLRTAAFIADEAEADYDKALDLYQRAMVFWPSPVDLRFRRRYISCLKKAKKPEEAKKVEQELEVVGTWFERGLQERLTAAMRSLPSPVAIDQFVEFYKLIGRDKEAQRWADLKNKPKVQTTPMPGIGSEPTDSGF